MNKEKNLFTYTIALAFVISIFSSLATYEFLYKDKNVDTAKEDKNATFYNYNADQNTETSNNIDKNNLKNIESTVKGIAKNISSSVVNIIISKDIQTYRTDPYGFYYEPSWVVKQKVGGWTGFFVDKNWLILTNKHVVADPNASYTIITSKNEEFDAKILAYDPSTDLAIVKAYTKDWKEVKNTPAVKFINETKSIEVGNFVIAVGNALAEFQNTVTFWVISGLGRSIQAWDINGQGSEQLSWLIQTDAAINPGNSGWPLLNLDNEVMGINTAIAAGANWLGFAIPLSQKEVNHLITSIDKYSKIKRPFIWIRYIPNSAALAKQFKLKYEYWDYIPKDNNTSSVVEWSPAQKAWIEAWDLILEVNWNKLEKSKTMKDFIKDKFPGDKIVLKILKSNWEEKTIEVILGEM